MLITPRKSLNKAFLKLRPNRLEIENFKEKLKSLLSKIDEIEREENQKNHVRDFLRDSYYSGKYEINTKDTKDLVIHNGKDSKSSVGVIIEAKRPTNKSEMLTKENVNAKALQELVLYFLRERITAGNKEIKYLIATNIYEWFVFDAQDCEKIFAANKDFVKQFTDFEEKRLSGTKTDFFYKEIAEPFLGNHKDIPFTYFDIRDFRDALENSDPKDDVKLIALFKLLSPEHLLKLPFLNDSNSLDKSFYSELLHIIGLEETKDGSKKIIQRKKSGERNSASLIENAIIELDSLDKIHRIENSSQYGNTYEEKLFSIAIELVITWVNRILFLKLLEAQQIKYHKGDENFSYLHSKKIKGFDDLNTLFFQVLSRKTNERSEEIKKLFALVPYLNSSLFEISTLEDRCFTISQLKDKNLPLFSGTVLKENTGKKKTGELPSLEYFFEFLNAYDFSSEGSEEIQEENKTLINASVLGLIFEKINGYKDGSFFTPGFITTHMCKETIRRAVVQKFNETKGWNCKDFDELCIKIDDIDTKEANRIINSLRICDPAVGSGHFLVSALNEIIAIKSELGILADRGGKRIRDYSIEVENDELIICQTVETHGDASLLFEYNPKNKESQRIQEALFHEKQTIIENCLFGVDINQNSVNICRLRLWIELLKNAYYIVGTRDVGTGHPVGTGRDLSLRDTELQTLPNIDINIKKGNSLISKHALDSDIKTILEKRKWKIEDYKNAVKSYQNAKDKSEKRDMDVLIHNMKTEFIVELNDNHPDQVTLRKLNQKLSEQSMFERTKKELDEIEKWKKEKEKLETKIQEMKDNKIYQNSFEWRFEFPEVLDDEGNFIGFDVVIGNPPYISLSKLKEYGDYFEKSNYLTYSKGTDIYCLFYERGSQILKKHGYLTVITSNSWLRGIYGDLLKKYFIANMTPLALLNIQDVQIFEEATVESNIITLEKDKSDKRFMVCNLTTDYNFGDSIADYFTRNSFEYTIPESSEWVIGNEENGLLKLKIEKETKLLKEHNISINFGFKTGLNEAFIIDEATKDKLLAQDKKNSEIIKPIVRGRDLKKYSYEFSKQWAICTFPSLKINIDEFPSIKDYFIQFGKERLEQAGNKGSRKKTNNKWFETQDAISYWKDFEKPKIIWGEISDKPKFAYDEDNYYAEATTFIMVGDNLKYLLAILNSKVSEWYFNQISTTTGMGTNRWKKYKIELLPIKVPTENQKKEIESKVEKIIEAKKKDPAADTGKWEKEIDVMVYELYGLTEEEIGIVEG